MDLVKHIESFDFGMEEASVVCQRTDNLVELIKTAPEANLNDTTMQVLYQAIEGFQERSGVFYNTLALESAKTPLELKTATLEGLKEFAANVWQAIKKAIAALYNKIKEYFSSGEKQVKDLKDDLKDAQKEFKDVEDSILKADKEATSVVMELVGPSPYLIHKTLYGASSPVKKTNLHDVVTNLKNYAMTSKEHHLLDGISDFKEDIDRLVNSLGADSFDTGIFDKVYVIMNNYVSDKKLTDSAVAGMRQHKNVLTKLEFDSEYASKRYIVSFGVAKKKVDEDATALMTDQVIGKVHISRDTEKLLVEGVESRDMGHLVSAVEENLDYLTKQVGVSKELLGMLSAIEDMIADIDAGKLGNLHSGHSLTLAAITKAINAIIKLFGTIRTDYGKVVSEHLNLYMRMVEELKSRVQPQ